MRLRRLVGWNGIAMAGSLVLIGVALVILAGTLRDIAFDRVIAAIRTTPPRAMLAACLFVFACYGTLTLYDYFALHAVGRREIPYTTAALASFTSYAIGRSVGIAFLTASAVRLRIYSLWGLSVAEVAKISFISGLTFWLGNICALGFALSLAPGAAVAVTKLPVWADQALGIVALACIAGYVAWIVPTPRTVGPAYLRVALPNARRTFFQIGIGVLDLAAGSLAIYMLLPSAPSSDYVIVAVAYVIAALAGFLSHAPGSLGVFEAAMLVLLPQYRTEDLLASLLILHVLYFVLPLAAALLVLGVREIGVLRPVRAMARADRRAVAP